MSNRFYFDDDDSSASSADLDDLPYPQPLSREAFLKPDFDPTVFLSSLQNRFQTLEDLRSELRQRSQDLSKELLDLVNSNYEDFLSLGQELRGGDEKVEEVRLGLLGFRRDVETLRDHVKRRRVELERLIGEKRRIRENVVLGRGLLEVNRRIGDLEERLMLVQNGAADAGAPDDDDAMAEVSEGESEDDEADGGLGTWRLRRHAEQYIYITKLVERLGSSHPFLAQQEDRISRLRQTVLLDLDSAVKQAKGRKSGQQPDIFKILQIYKTMNASREAVEALKATKLQKG